MNFTLTIDQQNALDKIQSFINDVNQQVFILKGSAGSGKTTLIRELLTLLKKEQRLFQVMAPTGRAAKVLRDKMGEGITIHRGIYNFDRLESEEIDNDDNSQKSYHYYFPLRIKENANIIIVDEASMISDVETQHELFSFGSGKLLSDLIEYANFKNKYSKLIFIGDEAQLPPVTDNKSRAFDEMYFKNKGLNVAFAKLETIHRQLDNSEILQNANALRSILALPMLERSTFNITTGNDVKEIPPELIASNYVNRYPIPEIGNGVVISFSNEQAYNYNKAIRDKIFPENKELVPGDIVLINKNNYTFYDIEVFNGDMAKVVDCSTRIEKREIPVYIQGQKKIVSLSFRDITIRLPYYSDAINCKIIDSLLNSTERDLSLEEMKALYIDFCIRFNDEQKKNKEKGLICFREGSEEFKLKLKNDPYFNALKIKYGYAITCHKAQGGEWDTVYVDYSGRIGLFDDALRWCYTATTRAKKELIGANLPKIDGFQKLSFTPIAKVSTINDNYYQDSNLYQTPYHAEFTHIAKRLKYHEIKEKLENTPFSIVGLESFEFLEKYTFEVDLKHIDLNLYHNKAGVFKSLVYNSSVEEEKELIEILNKPYYLYLPLSYTPSTDLLNSLYQKVSTACSELDIQITNIIEYSSNYYVLYLLKTSGNYSYIQFYYSNKKGFSTANPKSDLGGTDEKLQLLINQLK